MEKRPEVKRMEDVRAIIDAILRASEAGALMKKALKSNALTGPTGPVLAVGKAAPAMYQGFASAAEEVPAVLMLAPEGVAAPEWALRGRHPIPDLRNVEAAHRVVEFVGQARDGRLTLLLSGGASALLTLPAAGLSLEDVQQVMQELLASGADIRQINCVRKHIEQLKGGRLAALAATAEIDAYVLSDVIGDDPGSIGSGPVSPDDTTYGDARQIIERFAPSSQNVLAYLKAGEAGMHPETPGPGDPIFDRVNYRIVGGNATATAAARQAAEALGYRVIHVEENITGQAAEVGRRLARRAIEGHGRARTENAPGCIIFGGETTVILNKNHGRGGRNQEMALAAAIELEQAGIEQQIVIAALATDGVDGPTDAAGAVVDGQTCARARNHGAEPGAYLQNNDSHTLFGRLTGNGGGLIRTGPTGTNVNDVAFALFL